jgi:hypothetical protein
MNKLEEPKKSRAIKGISLALIMLIACIGLALNPGAVHADPTAQPDWYEGETSWSDLTPEQQKDAYMDRIGFWNNTITGLKALYQLRRSEVIALLDEHDFPDGMPQPPVPPADPDDAEAMGDFFDALTAWIQAMNTWLDNNPDIDPELVDALVSIGEKYQAILALLNSLSQAKAERAATSQALANHCAHYSG